MKTIYLVIGAPGSGKTSAVEKINHKNITHYSIGAIYRDRAEIKDYFGKIVKKYIDNGDIVPIDIAKNVITGFLNKGTEIIIIDGFPRDIEQAKMFDGIVKNKYLFKGVINVLVDKEIAFQRTVKRKRGPDDNPELFNHRFEVYENDINKIRKYYIKKKLYYSINGNLQLNDVTKSIEKIIFNNYPNCTNSKYSSPTP